MGNSFPAAFAVKNLMLLYRMKNIAVTAELNNTDIMKSSVLSVFIIYDVDMEWQGLLVRLKRAQKHWDDDMHFLLSQTVLY